MILDEEIPELTDLHCHILPKIDDGARNLSESVAMAQIALKSGVDQICATPHFPGVEESLALLPKILSRVNQLRDELAFQRIPVEILPGAEILCMPETIELADKGMLPTLGNSRYLLTEFYFDTPGEEIDRMLQGLGARGYYPVVAHPERYQAVQKRPGLVRRWFEMGFVIQLNKGSILGAFGSGAERCAIELLHQGGVHLIASDAHRMDFRTTNLEPVYAWAVEHLGVDYADVLLRRNPKRILHGQPPVGL